MSMQDRDENPYAAPEAGWPTRRCPSCSCRPGTRLRAILLDGCSSAVVVAGFPAVLAGRSGRRAWRGRALLGCSLGLSGRELVLLAQRPDPGQVLLDPVCARRQPSAARIFFARYLPVTVLGMCRRRRTVSLVDALMIFRDNRRCLHDEIADTSW
jgi:hypothetical protein